MLKPILFIVIFSIFLSGCNKNLSDDEKKELWDNAQTQGEIIRRSGTPFNLATNPELAMRDAENRLITGGGLLGKATTLSWGGDKKNKEQNNITGVGMPINPYLWKATLETLNFMPLSSTDPFAGTIITDWYTSEKNTGERCKLNVFINGQDLKTANLKVSSFCQVLNNNQWVNMLTDQESDLKLENAILNKAKKLKLGSS
jgi:hypothetical protein